MGDVTTSPSDPALFFSYHAYVDKNHFDWMKSMQENYPEKAASNFTYPSQVTTAEFEKYAEQILVKIPELQTVIDEAGKRMKRRGYVKPVTYANFDMMMWSDLKNSHVLSARDAVDAVSTPEMKQKISAVLAEIQKEITGGTRTYATSGPYAYLNAYAPQDYFNRGKSANVFVPWVPGTLLDDVNTGGFPFRNLFDDDDGGEDGYTNYDILRHTLPDTSPYTYGDL